MAEKNWVGYVINSESREVVYYSITESNRVATQSDCRTAYRTRGRTETVEDEAQQSAGEVRERNERVDEGGRALRKGSRKCRT